jgi:photosynthetic reaction center cytochrome c subunit
MKRKIVFVTFVIFASFVVKSAAQTPQGPTAEQVYKNIQVLTGTPAGDLNQAMHVMSAALGVVCEHCHVEGEGPAARREADDRPAKTTARRMMRMVKEINETQFGGRQMVTCFTCHRGSTKPVAVPDMVSFTEPKVVEAAPKLPAVDEVLSKYVDALGGSAAIRKITSRVITGTQYIPTGPGGRVPVPAIVEQYRKAPNLYVNIYRTPTFTISDGFDGKTAWSQDQNGRVTEPPMPERARATREADFYEPLNLKSQYASLIVTGLETVDGHDAFVVMGVPRGDNPEKLYFDAQSGLLLRKTTYLTTQTGGSPFRRNFDDYRLSNAGVKTPFTILLDPAGPRLLLWPTATLRVTTIEENVPIADSKFARPVPAAPR